MVDLVAVCPTLTLTDMSKDPKFDPNRDTNAPVVGAFCFNDEIVTKSNENMLVICPICDSTETAIDFEIPDDLAGKDTIAESDVQCEPTTAVDPIEAFTELSMGAKYLPNTVTEELENFGKLTGDTLDTSGERYIIRGLGMLNVPVSIRMKRLSKELTETDPTSPDVALLEIPPRVKLTFVARGCIVAALLVKLT